MTPLDDELRRTLSERASLLAPSPDPLAGVEARATRIRRRRAAVAMAGAAAVVAAVALAVPILVPQRDNAPQPAATPSPTAVAQSDAVLDPDDPWAFRGTPLSSGTLATFRQDWAARHPGGGTLTPLWSQVYEPSNLEEAAFVADGRYGFVLAAESGPNFAYDAPIPSGTTALPFVLPGDEVPRLVVVAAPSTQRVEYAPDGTTFRDITLPSNTGVGVIGLDDYRPMDRVRVIGSSGEVVYDQPAPDKSSEALPGNVLPWQERGDATVGPSVAYLQAAFARFHGHSAAGTAYQRLFTADTDSGVRYTIGQAWFSGDSRATSVSYAEGGTSGAVLRQYGFTPDGAAALVALIEDLPGTTTDLLVVVPRPMIGQVSYSPDATTPFAPVASGRSDLNGIGFIDRAKNATADRLELLDGDGDLDHPLSRGPVTTLLAGDPVH